MIRNIIKRRKDGTFLLAHKLLHGVFGVIYVPNAIIFKKVTPKVNFHEIKKLSGAFYVSSKGEKITGFTNSDVIFFTLKNDCLVFYKKEFNLNRPIPKLKENMLRPKLVFENADLPEEQNFNCFSRTYDPNHIHIDTRMHQRCLKSKEIDVTLRFDDDGGTFIELRDAGLEYTPTMAEYREVYGKTLQPIIQDGLTYRIKKQGKKGCTLNVQLPPSFLHDSGYEVTKERNSFPTWFDYDNQRIVVELPKIECAICGEEETSIGEYKPAKVKVCPDCSKEMGKGNGVNKLVDVVTGVSKLAETQKNIVKKSEDDNRTIIERLLDIEKVIGEIKDIAF